MPSTSIRRQITSTRSAQIWGGSYAAQTVGSIVSATTSRSERRNAARSRSRSAPESRWTIGRAPPPELGEHSVRRYEKRVPLQQPPDDHHRVRSHDVHHHAPAKLGEIVRSRDGVVVLWKNVVQPRLVLDDVFDAGRVL